MNHLVSLFRELFKPEGEPYSRSIFSPVNWVSAKADKRADDNAFKVAEVKTKELDISGNRESKVLLKNDRFYREFDSWIDIDTSITEVWDTLVDFESWKNWNSLYHFNNR